MANQTTDERSISHIRLSRPTGRPFYIYFGCINTAGSQIYYDSAGLLYFNYPNIGSSLMVHSTGAPAIRFSDGSLVWVENGRYHREDGPAIIDTALGINQYWLNGEHIETEQWISDDAQHTDYAEHADDSNIIKVNCDSNINAHDKSNQSNDDILTIAIAAFGTISLLNAFGRSSSQRRDRLTKSKSLIYKG